MLTNQEARRDMERRALELRQRAAEIDARERRRQAETGSCSVRQLLVSDALYADARDLDERLGRGGHA